MTEGYLSEVFSSFQGEGGSVLGSAMGRRQIFVRLSGCNIAQKEFGTLGCAWCDSPEAKIGKGKKFRFERKPGSSTFEFFDNPISAEKVASLILEIDSPDLHSISFTGGEPTIQPEFLIATAKILKENNKRLFLETNGTTQWKDGYESFDYFSIDLKDKTSNAGTEWQNLIEREIKFGKAALQSIRNKKNIDLRQTGVYFKLVISKDSDANDLIPYVEELAKWNAENQNIQAAIVIQPVTPTGNFKAVPSFDTIIQHTTAFSKILGSINVSISLQMHKYMNIL